MPKQESIKKNYVYNTLYRILTIITPLITAPYISRVLGSDGVGVYSYTNSIATYFTLFAALGTASYGQREIAMHRDSPEENSKLFWEIELLSVATTAVALIFWTLWIFISKQYTSYYLVLSMSVLAVVFDISWYFGGFEKFKYIVIRNSIVRILGIVLLFVFIKDKNDTLLYVALITSTGLLGNISMWFYLPKMLVKVNRKNLHPFKNHLKQTFMYFVPTIATSVYTVLDKTMIGAITKSADENGYYEQATKIVHMFQSLIFSLNTVMSARQSYLFSLGKIDEIKDKIAKSFDYLFALSIPLMFGLVAVAQNFVPWFFGTGYEPVIKILCAMSPLPFVITISNILGSQYLTPSGQRVRSTKGIISGAVVNVVLNALLIPKFHAIGAVGASVVAELVISIIYVHMSRTVISWRQLLKTAWKKILASAIMFIAIVFIPRIPITPILITISQFIVGVIVYVLALLILRDSFVTESIKYLKEKLKSRHSEKLKSETNDNSEIQVSEKIKTDLEVENTEKSK